MQSEVRHNLTITGNGSSSGGIFRNVKILGDAKVDGDLDCLAFKCTGSALITGNVKSTSCHINGEARLKGNLETGRAKILGVLDIDGSVKTNEMISTGETRIRGDLAGEDVTLEGHFSIKGNCEAENLEMKGVLTIGGLLNAGKVELKIYSKCEVKEIGGEKIDIRRGTSSIFKRLIGMFYLPSDFHQGMLQVDTIEGDDIYVEHTSAKAIRGTNVIIGPGCTIGHVEYTNQFQKTDDSVIGSHTQV
jgi:cytoskeletal protein CcmA (bactofilin family)